MASAAHAVPDADKSVLERDFTELVNMPPAKLRSWLSSDESRSVGMSAGGEKVTGSGDGESVGHHMGSRILEIRATAKAKLTDADYADMRKVVGYVRRHLAQRPKGDMTETRWRYSLMNWGHDPV